MEEPLKVPSPQGATGSAPPRRRSRLATLAAWWTVLVVAIGTVLGSAPLYQGFRQSLVDSQVDQLRMQARLAATSWSGDRTAAIADTQALTVVPPLNAIDTLRTRGIETFEGADEQRWRQRLETIYSGVLESNPEYLQVRYVRVEDDGREVVRVQRTRSGDPIEVVASGDLQSKQAEPYFAPSLALDRGQVLTSEISWNREHGVISEPRVLMVRYTAPVVSKDNKRRGFVILNVNIIDRIKKRLLANLDPEGSSYGFVVDEQGRWILPPTSSAGGSLLPVAPLEARGVAELVGPASSESNADSAYIVDDAPPGLPFIRHIVALRKVTLDNGHALQIGVLRPYSDGLAAVQAAMKGTVLASLFGLIVMGFVGWLGMGRLLRPLDAVVAQLAAFSTDGLAADSPMLAETQLGSAAGTASTKPSGNEAERLATEFVRMANRVSTQQRELKQEIEQRKTAENQLSDALRDAEAANSQLRAFSYSLAHDLRAPIRGVRFFAQTLGEDCGELLDIRGKEHLAKITASAERMSRLVEAIMRLAKLRQRTLHVEEVDLSLLVEQIVEELQGTEELRINFTIEPGLLAVGDKTMLESLLYNLLSNAVKYSTRTPRPEITFGTAQTEAGTAFFVRDNGIGFDDKHAEKVFQLFERLHHESEYEGLGVGLAIAQGIVERHAGHIWVEAFSGKGATFYFTLPNHAPN